MTAVIFATRREAAPFLKMTGQVLIEDGTPATYGHRTGDSMVTLVSGMGPQAARAAALTAVDACGAERLINAGICGALQNGSPWVPGAVFVVKRARHVEAGDARPSHDFACDHGGWGQLPTAELVTRSEPLFDAALRAKLARWGALVDMEGAAIASVAHERKRPCTLIKGVTDLAEEGGRDDLHRRLAGVSQQIANVLAAGLMNRAGQ